MIGIILLGWRKDVGGFIMMTYPPGKDYGLTPVEVMQIFNIHRQANKRASANFSNLIIGGWNIASFYSGEPSTDYLIVPNIVVSLLLDPEDNPNSYSQVLPALAKIVLSEINESLGTVYTQIQEDDYSSMIEKASNIGLEVEIENLRGKIREESKKSFQQKMELFSLQTQMTGGKEAFDHLVSQVEEQLNKNMELSTKLGEKNLEIRKLREEIAKIKDIPVEEVTEYATPISSSSPEFPKVEIPTPSIIKNTKKTSDVKIPKLSVAETKKTTHNLSGKISNPKLIAPKSIPKIPKVKKIKKIMKITKK